MTSMSQMQMHYFEEEDRFLLRMNTITEEEYRFWLTRRFIQIFYPLLNTALYSDPEIKRQVDPVNKDAILSFQQQNAKNQVEYGSTFSTTPKTYPLGEMPLLISKASIKSNADNGYDLRLSTADDRGLYFSLDQNLLHILTTLILDSLPIADWQLVLKEDNDMHLPERSTLLN